LPSFTVQSVVGDRQKIDAPECKLRKLAASAAMMTEAGQVDKVAYVLICACTQGESCYFAVLQHFFGERFFSSPTLTFGPVADETVQDLNWAAFPTDCCMVADSHS
jgi:hypothetical protein